MEETHLLTINDYINEYVDQMYDRMTLQEFKQILEQFSENYHEILYQKFRDQEYTFDIESAGNPVNFIF